MTFLFIGIDRTLGENAEIRARVTGHLLKRNYQEGTLVKKGDLLFEIDPPFQAACRSKSQLDDKGLRCVAAEADRSKGLFEEGDFEKEYINKTQLNEASVSKIAALRQTWRRRS